MRVTDKDNWMDGEQMNLKKNSPDQKKWQCHMKDKKEDTKKKGFFYFFLDLTRMEHLSRP